MSESAQGCVEIADLGAAVGVRDSKDLSKPAHVYPVSAWTELLAYLRGESPAGRIAVTVTDREVILSDRQGTAGQPHNYTHHEWACFLDGVQKREVQLIAA
jgi:hypothetical protein